MGNKKRPILAKGEEYIIPYKNENGIPPNDTRPSFEEARIKLYKEINNTLEKIGDTPKELLLDEVIINVKMDVNYSAKSYYPSALISAIDAKDVGSKKWIKEVTIMNKKKEKIKKNKIGSEIFLKISKSKLEYLQQQLSEGFGFTKGAIDNIRSIDELYFDDHTLMIEKFSSDWIEGRVELVLHPFDYETEKAKSQLLKLIKECGGDTSKVKFKTYDSGITFVSALLSKETLKGVLKYNPIRTAHPIVFQQLPTIRTSSVGLELPFAPLDTCKSEIKVGVFDGGIDISNPYLTPYANEHNPIPNEKNNNFLSHGTGVAGAILYGDLSNYKPNTHLPLPSVNVESFRVFPLSDDNDIELYEVIDIIEDIVPKRPDIQVYNLSIGPYGAIDDDYITRFTYAIDELSKRGDKLFVVAVGNDGNLDDDDLCRIQAPSDSVNCIGVGAYSNSPRGELIRADYSSYGDGREGCKIKPDLLEFGGSHNNPFEIISIDGNCKSATSGTSFAAPIISSKAAEIIGRCNLANPLLARTLLVHTTNHPQNKSDRYMGHGIAQYSTDDILECSGNSVTTIYQSRLRATQSIKLPLPFLNNIDYKGMVQVKWTIALATEVDARNTEDYTLSCIEDTFYPNSNKYKMYRYENRKIKQSKIVDISKDGELISEYLDSGWESSKNPISYSNFSNKYKPENERKENFKWDTITKRSTKKMRVSSLNNPYLVLHAMNRHNCKSEFVNYAVAVTIDYLDVEEDIYDLTLKSYNKLEVAQIRAVNEILVR